MMMKLPESIVLLLIASLSVSMIAAFIVPHHHGSSRVSPPLSAVNAATKNNELRLAVQKKKLLQLLRVTDPVTDAVLGDPVTKECLTCVTKTALLIGGDVSSGTAIKYQLTSSTNTYAGSSDTFLNLMEPVKESATDERTNGSTGGILLKNLLPFIPPPLRSALATAGLSVGADYVPMRDLFTSPAVSYAYERGWRQGFGQAGFPGAEQEAAFAMEYFEPAMANSQSSRVLVDMSCATGLFTRRFAASGKYKRVLGCDYSVSMLEEARRRIRTDQSLTANALKETRLDLVRLDVGQIPMKDGAVDALHAGAAMHCWPDLPTAVSEIYRVLKPDTGRYFATTFLSQYFGTLQKSEGGATGPSRQAFQYFASVEQLRSLMESGGFERDKIFIEVLGSACVVIRCEK